MAQRNDAEHPALRNLKEIFKERLPAAIEMVLREEGKQEPFGSLREWLADAIAQSPYIDPDDPPRKSTIENWFKGKNLPRTNTFVAVAEATGKSIDWLLGMPTPYPHLKVDKGRYDFLRGVLLRLAQNEVWLQLTTGTTFGDREAADLLHAIEQSQEAEREFSIRVLLSSPDDDGTLLQIARRRQLFQHQNRVASDIERTIENFVGLAEHAGLIDFKQPETLKHLQIVTMPYVATNTIWMSDPMSNGREVARMLVIETNFDDHVSNAPMVELLRSAHREAFDWYVANFARMWKWALSKEIAGQVDLERYRVENRHQGR